MLLLLVGVSLFCSVVLDLSRGWVAAIHLLAAGLLFYLSAEFIRIGGWINGLNYALVGLGLLLTILQWKRIRGRVNALADEWGLADDALEDERALADEALADERAFAGMGGGETCSYYW